MNQSLVNCIVTDILETFSYLWKAFFIGVGYMLFYQIIFLCIHRVRRRNSGQLYGRELRMNRKYFLGSTLFVIYFVVLLYTVFFSREAGSRVGTNVSLFATWGVTMQEHAWVIENVLLFIPFGFLCSLCLPKRWRWVSLPVGCICSIAIEYIQFCSGCGYCQLDDIVMNTLGTVIGYLLYCVVRRIMHKTKKSKQNNKKIK